MSYVIIKNIRSTPILLLDEHEEVWEFSTIEEAEKIARVLETSSDAGCTFEVKKIGENKFS